MSYDLTQRAHCDLEEVDDYLSRRNVKAARDFIVQAVETFELLASHPEIGRRRPELKTGVRSFPLGNYIVIQRRKVCASCANFFQPALVA
jgi:toxin ParE1/3/4